MTVPPNLLSSLCKHVQVLITNLIALRREKCTTVFVLDPRLDLLGDEDITHLAMLEDVDLQQPDILYEIICFQFDPHFDENERMYESTKRDILGAGADGSTPVSDNEHVNSGQPQTRLEIVRRSLQTTLCTWWGWRT